MARAIFAFVLFGALAFIALYFLFIFMRNSYLDSRKAKEDARQIESDKVQMIAMERVLTKDVDDAILTMEFEGQKAPIDLLRARLAITQQRTEAGKQRALIDLGEVFARYQEQEK